MIEAKDAEAQTVTGTWKLPSGWKWVTIGSICTINLLRPRLTRAPQAPTSFLPMANVDEKDGNIKKLETKPYRQVARGFTYFEENDVLFAKITPSMENGKCAIARNLIDGLGFGSTEFHVIRPGPRITPRWLYYFLRRRVFRLDAKEHFTGAVGQQRVPDDFISTSLIPLPDSIDLQDYLADRIESLLADLKNAQATLSTMRRDINKIVEAAQQEVFEELVKNVKFIPLELLATKIGSGSTPRGAHYVDTGIPFIRSMNVQWNKFSSKELKYINPAVHEQRKGTEVLTGDVLLNITGASIGRACCAPEQYVPANVNQHVTIIRPKKELQSRFLMYWLTSSLMQKAIFDLQSGATRQALTQTQIEQFLIPFPDLLTQEYIFNYLDAIESQVNEMQNTLKENDDTLQQVEQAILNEAFRGKL
jgi:type I restriction enzyme S subunit